MGKEVRKMGLAGIFWGMLLFGSNAISHETTGELETKIIRLQEIRSAHHQERQQFLDEREKLENQIRDLSREKAALDEWVSHEQDEQKKLRDQLENFQLGAHETQKNLGQLAEVVSEFAQEIYSHIETGISFDRAERLGRLDAISNDLEKPEPEMLSQGIEGFLDFISDELETIGSIDLWNDFLELGHGQNRHAYQMRIGLVFQAFVTEDGTVCGLADHKNPGKWHMDLTSKQVKQLTQSLRILQKRRVPQLCDLPFYFHAD